MGASSEIRGNRTFRPRRPLTRHKARRQRRLSRPPDIIMDCRAGARLACVRFLEHFRFSSNRRNALTYCFYAILNTKPLRTFAGIGLAEVT